MTSIDTIFGDDQNKSTDSEKLTNAKTFAVRLSVHQEADSTTLKISPAAYAQKTWSGFTFPRYVYCVLSDIELQLTQTGDGAGYSYLKFTQDCNSRMGDDVDDPDWSFNVALYDNGGAFIRNIYLGEWEHKCGKQLVELQENFSWVIGSINPILFAQNVTLTWTFKQEVSPC